MKNILLTTILITSFSIKAQVKISNESNPSITNSSVSLEFGNEGRGIILPYVITTTGSVEGTILLDTTDNKVKYKNGTGTNDWFELSPAAIASDLTTSLSAQGTDKVEKATSKVTIGTTGATDSTQGILVLTDANKVMILPKVASPHQNIISPSPGLIVYDTTAKQLAVFNGTKWSFWKP
ncbi:MULTISPECIES: hypothetical protein [unclassified Chryseobacterium]|uniref:hypothetical protein n=1 Tax=unclassified Chryseobacterium TaxID=2593645 RepID=UPI00100AE6AB|nr:MULTISPECIES: hypothetical protein [unclassified Chryseobacterium]RXM50613.1 hypothetical protein BOQ64_17885 [Chryseobacterium sp. CH25]RXM63247.1 hypothetical protein BOQ60_18085 [Chryseobacterium sp. CH1]